MGLGEVSDVKEQRKRGQAPGGVSRIWGPGRGWGDRKARVGTASVLSERPRDSVRRGRGQPPWLMLVTGQVGRGQSTDYTWLGAAAGATGDGVSLEQRKPGQGRGPCW